jgi:dihydrofolate reductase
MKEMRKRRMRRLVLLEHISLDGFLAGPGGDMAWIRVDEEIWDYVTPIIDAADTAVYGRTTYQIMQSYWPTAASQPDATAHDLHHAAWTRTATKLVFSKTLPAAPWDDTSDATLIREDVAPVIRRLRQESGKDMVVLGSASLARTLITEGLVDDYRLNVNPVVVGSGTSLFPDMTSLQPLRLASCRTFQSGVVGLHYTAP